MRFGPKGAIVFWPKGAILLGQKSQNYTTTANKYTKENHNKYSIYGSLQVELFIYNLPLRSVHLDLVELLEQLLHRLYLLLQVSLILRKKFFV